MKEYQAVIERDVLAKTNHPNIIKLFYSFKNQEKLFFVLENCPNGELFDLINLFQQPDGTLSFPFELARFYTAEILNMIEYLKSLDISHRDLKPENILISERMHLKLVTLISLILVVPKLKELVITMNKILLEQLL